MQKVKWIFFGYLGVVAAVVLGIAVSFRAAPPRDPKTLYIPYAGSIRTFDPAEVNDTIGGPLVGYVYECLYNYKYGVRPYTLFPELAAEMPEISDDGLTMTIKLRKGIHFYDPHKQVFPDGVGPEIKAGDVIYSLKRICDFNLASPNYSAFQGVFQGLDQWWDYTQHTPAKEIDWQKPIEGMQAVDDYTVRFKLTHINPQLIFHFAQEMSGIVCRKAVEYYGESFRQHPVGSGAYALAENLPEQRLTYVANPIYRGAPDIDGEHAIPPQDPNHMPHIQRIELEYFDEQLPVWILLQQGLFDGLSDVPKDSIRGAIQSGNLTPELQKKGLVLNKVTTPTTDFIAFNMKDKILGGNRPLRQAMSMAFDRKNYVDIFQMGRGLPANGMIPPGLATYNADAKNPYTEYNLSRARELMKEAERIQGGPIPPMTLLMRDSDTLSRQMAEYFCSQMAQIGVTLHPEYRDWARYQDMVDNRQTQVFDAGWQGDYPDEQNFLQLCYSANIPNAGLNEFCYKNEQFDKLYEQAINMQDTPQRRALYEQMEQILNEDCPAIWEYYIVYFTLKYDWVQNSHWMDYGYGLRQYTTLDSKLRLKRFNEGDFRK